ncbi:MAG TPA: amidohydrolase family protein [Acidimicrobiales bacterium]|nr:amidohydrolase family protein [Acidimicrobiales bacterium]
MFDADTHVNPTAEVLERYADDGLQRRLPDLAPFRVPAEGTRAATPGTHHYRIGTALYRRVLGEAGPHESFVGEATTWRGTRQPRPGVQDDHSANRVRDMDEEGADVHLTVPASWTSVVGLGDPELETGLIRAFHRYMADFCGPFPGRLRGVLVASGQAVDDAVGEIRRWGTSLWPAAVMPLLAEGVPVDHPELEPVWAAAADFDLPIVHHSDTWNPPYFPGHKDMWDNVFLARMASHPWGAMRFVASFVGAGILDRYPSLRVGVLEAGFGWLPFWARRMDEQIGYVGGTPPLKCRPSEYLTGGRFFCSIEVHEGEETFASVTERLGDGVLMYASDYPHAECQFPDSPANVLGWSSVSEPARRKLLHDNAARFVRG